MNLRLAKLTKILLICTCIALSILGFMVKLPTSFRHFDKELHSLFYFTASAFLNILLTNRKIVGHALIFGSLFLFGVFIEYAQGYSNKIFHKRIHGRFDPQDIQSNVKGLVAFSILWILFVAFVSVYNNRKIKELVTREE